MLLFNMFVRSHYLDVANRNQSHRWGHLNYAIAAKTFCQFAQIYLLLRNILYLQLSPLGF